MEYRTTRFMRMREKASGIESAMERENVQSFLLEVSAPLSVPFIAAGGRQ
jgi:hypothetical protein